jgi:hypothetical protein
MFLFFERIPKDCHDDQKDLLCFMKGKNICIAFLAYTSLTPFTDSSMSDKTPICKGYMSGKLLL